MMARPAGPTDVPPTSEPSAPLSSGWALLCGVGAYGLWGVIPLYFKAVGHVPVFELLAHRIVGAFALLAAFLTLTNRWGPVGVALRHRRTLLTLAVTTALIAVNWLVFIYAVVHHQLADASLGYFINPLLNVALGVGVLGERLRRWQGVSLALAGVGVAVLVVLGGSFPWIALSLAFSFALYGLLRKTCRADAVVGLVVETLLMLPLGAGYLLYLAANGAGHLSPRWADPNNWLMLASGPVTAVPLLLFAAAARGLPLATLGFLQYMAPTIQFLLAVLAFGEPLDRAKLGCFALIWLAVGVFLADLALHRRRQRLAAADAGTTADAGGTAVPGEGDRDGHPAVRPQPDPVRL